MTLEKRKPDYKVYLDITADGNCVKNVISELYLPKRNDGDVEIICILSPDQSYLFDRLFSCSVFGEIGDSGGIVDTVFSAQKAYRKEDSSRIYWSNQISDTVLILEIADFTISHPKKANEPENSSNLTKGSFWLTPCFFLCPRKIIRPSYTGEITVETIDNFEFTLANSLKLCFDDHYRFIKDHDSDETRYFPELVAEFQTTLEPKEISSMLPYIDDFLMLVSFASRHRCACVGWDVWNKDEMVTYYRRDITIPQDSTRELPSWSLIDVRNFSDFIIKSYDSFCKASDRFLLRKAIFCVIPSEERLTENRYLSLFSGVESLILLFRRQFNLELALPGDDFTIVCKDIAKLIKKHEYCSDKTRRRFVHEKLKELNRISFGTAYNAFLKKHPIDLEDLWSLSGDTGGISLAGIRNHLIHGNFYDKLQFKALCIAQEHLKCLLERLILAYLEWPIEKSNVSRKCLSHGNKDIYKNWHKYREILSSTNNGV